MQEKVFEEMIAHQEERLYRFAQKIIPNITKEDLLQPNDFPVLENHPIFRYEEGVLEGLRSAWMAWRSERSNGRG